MSAPLRRTRVVAALLVLGSGAVAGCDYEGASSLPLPGGAGAGGYQVSMVFDDATNLVPKETCRTGDQVVGSVESIELRDDLKAEVVCRIDPDVDLPGNVVPVIRETSLLGERFVSLEPPAGQAPRGTLPPDSHLGQADSHVVPDVEIVLGALSQVLNGSSLGSVETISRELSTALSGSDVRGVTRELATLMATMNAHRGDIVDALDAVDRLSAQLARQRSVIAGALDSIPAGLESLDRQLPRLVTLLNRLGDLSDVAVPLIARTRADTVADLQMLAPTLENVAAAKKRLTHALEGIITFPFPSYTKYVTQGDYAGMFATMTLDLDSINALIASRGTSADAERPASGAPAPPSLPELPSLPDLPQLPDLPGLPDGTLGLPDLPGLGTGSTGSPDGTGSLGDLLTPPEQQVTGRLSRRHADTLANLLTGAAS